jgi:hypothetical protein
MSSNARRMPEINLEDFERKLRAAGSGQGGVEDPLEELTRLVNTIANERPRDERVVDFSPVRPMPRQTPAPPALLQHDDEPEFTPPPEVYSAPRRTLPASREDIPALESPLLRPTYTEEPETVGAGEPIEEAEAVDDAEAPAVEAVALPTRKRSWYLKVGGLTALAVLMVAGAVTLKFGGAVAGSKAPPMIMAAVGPDKVAPPDAATVQSANDTGALLSKDSTAPGPVKIISDQEQPSALALKGESPVAPMKDSPIIAPNQAPMVMTPAVASAPSPPPVSVRPDGTLIVADAAPASTYTPAAVASAPQPAPRKPEPAPSVTSLAASPTLDLPPAKAPKSSQRVAVGKTDTTAPTEPMNGPLQLGSAAPQKAGKLPTKLSPPQRVADAAATDATPTATVATGGDWAVQLAAPRSDADAQSAIQRLQTKYGSTLGDTELGVRKAEVNGETIYRVRTSGLSKSEAFSLCQKLKADGGACFIARN